MKKSLLLLYFLVLSLGLCCITLPELLKLQKLDRYLVGHGVSEDRSKAIQYAQSDLANSISCQITSVINDISVEQGREFSSDIKQVIKTYSNVSLDNLKKLESQVAGNYSVYVYISRADLEKMFSDRESEIQELIDIGVCEESKGHIIEALRNYSWAYCLLYSHPHGSKIVSFIDEKEQLAKVGLLNKIEKLLSRIEFYIDPSGTRRFGNSVEFLVRAVHNDKDQNIIENGCSGIRISYHDGTQWSRIQNWSDGSGLISVSNKLLQSGEIKIKVDYLFENCSYFNGNKNLLNFKNKLVLNNATKQVKLTNKFKESVKVKQHKKVEFTSDNTLTSKELEVLSEVIDAVQKNKLYKAKRHFTPAGCKYLTKMLGYGSASLVKQKVDLMSCELNGEKVVRSIPFKFHFSGSGEDFIESVNFTFNPDDKISSLSFGLSKGAIRDINGKSGVISFEKMQIINFMERYKTAYCLKDTLFVSNVFTDDPLKIVGNKVETFHDHETNLLHKDLYSKYNYVRYSKGEYIQRLLEQFKNKEYINLKFCDNHLQELPGKGVYGIYGIQIKQLYYSDNYADKGYLFLMFDLSDLNIPKIKVRIWQPKKAKDGSIIGMKDFDFD